MLSLDIWIIHKRKVVQVSDMPGPPVEICGYVSQEAADAAKARGHATISEIGFPADCFIGPFEDWDTAWKAANDKAAELGYEAEDATSLWDMPDDDDDYEPEYDFDDYGDEFDDDDF